MIDIRQGDCLELMRSIPDKSIDLILCDLPYGSTACKWDTVIPLELLWVQYNRIIKDVGAIVLFGSEPFASMLRMSQIKIYKYDWVWDKVKGLGFFDCEFRPLKTHETISVFSKSGCANGSKPAMKYFPQGVIRRRIVKNAKKQSDLFHSNTEKKYVSRGSNYPKSILTVSKDKSKSLHPTQKPVALLEYLILTYTNAGDIVLDNCMGSGSTGVACVNTNRSFIGFELDTNFFEISQARINDALRASASPSQMCVHPADIQTIAAAELKKMEV